MWAEQERAAGPELSGEDLGISRAQTFPKASHPPGQAKVSSLELSSATDLEFKRVQSGINISNQKRNTVHDPTGSREGAS